MRHKKEQLSPRVATKGSISTLASGASSVLGTAVAAFVQL